MLACVHVCLSVVSRAAWEGDMASIRLGFIWARPLLSVQGLWRAELQMGALGDGLYLSTQPGDSQGNSWCYFLPRAEGQGCSPCFMVSSGTGPAATSAH